MPGVVEAGRLRIADWESAAPKDAPGGAVEVFFRPDEVAFAPADGAGLAADVRAVAQRGPDVRIECVIEGQVVELQAHGPTLPPGVAPGLALRVRPLRPIIYAA
jgi:sulfate transport system ATP-binding protein